MHKRMMGLVVGGSVAALVLVGCGGGDSSDSKRASTTTRATGPAEPSDAALADYCEQATAIAPLLLVSGFAGSVGSAAGDEQSADTAVGALPLLFSQQFEAYFDAMQEVAPPALAAEAKKAVEVYATGPARLKQAGFTETEIEALAELDVADFATDANPVEGAADVDETVLQAEAAEFGAEIDRLTAASSSEADEQFDTLSKRCAETVSGGVNPCELLTDDEIAAALGVAASASDPESALGGGTGCLWNAGGNDDSNRRVALVVAGSSQYAQLEAQYEQAGTATTPVDGIGEAALFVEGFTSASAFSTNGRTIVVDTGKQAVFISVERDQDPVEDATLTALAKQAIAALS